MKRRFNIPFIFLLLVVLIPLGLQAQVPGTLHFDADNGLPGSKVYEVIQDRNGFMWFGTEDGAARFDGSRFEYFNASNGLPDDEVLNIYEDHAGRIWLMTFTGGVCYYYQGKLHTPGNNAFLKKINAREITHFIFESSDSTIYIPINLKGFWRVGKKDTTFIDFGTNFKRSAFKFVWEDSDKTIRTIFHRWDAIELAAQKEFNPVYIGDSLELPNQAGLFVQTRQGSLGIELSRGIFRLHDQKITWLCRFRSPTYDALCMAQLRNGDLLVSYFNKGVYSFHLQEDGSYLVAKDIILPGANITSVTEDKEGNLWLADLGNGVTMIRPQTMRSWNIESAGSNSNISAAIRTPSGQLVLAGATNHLFYFNSSSPDSLLCDMNTSLPRIYCLENGPEGMVFVGTGCLLFLSQISKEAEAALKKYSLDKLIVGNPQENPIQYSQLTGLIADMGSIKDMKYDFATHTLWAVSSGGLFSVEIYPGVKPENPTRHYGGRATSLCLDGEGNVIFTTTAGAYIYLKNENKTVALGNVYPELSGSANVVRYNPLTGVVFGMPTGLCFLRNKKITSLTAEHGLPASRVKHLAIDEKGTIWTAHSSGIAQVKTEANGKRSVRRINNADGLLSNDVNSIYAWKDTLYVCTAKGITIFSEAELNAESTQPPPCLITKIFVLGRDTLLQDGFSLPHTSNSIRFQFAGIHYASLGQMRYRYRLLGFDTAWVQTSVPEAWFNYLQPGDYVLQVFAINKNGTESEKPAELHFTILTPWFRTWTFRFAMVLLFATVIWVLLYFRYRARLRAETTRRQIMEAEHKALRAQMNPHFLFNTMNSIQRFIAANDRREAITYFSRLARLIRLMLDASRNKYVSLSDEIRALELYAQMEQLRTENKFEFQISVEPGVITEALRVPPMLLQPYVENAIWHGIMNKEGEGLITVHISRKGDFLKCVIEDDGVGREKAAQLKEGSASSHKSHGTQISEERLRLLFEGNANENPIVISDRTDKEGMVCGTRVSILIPLLI